MKQKKTQDKSVARVSSYKSYVKHKFIFNDAQYSKWWNTSEVLSRIKSETGNHEPEAVAKGKVDGKKNQKWNYFI